jgi:protein kinase C substrate 80K-H
LRAHHATLETELKELKGILDDLTKGYNPNYQDMAVKAAVVGYEELYAPAQAAATDLPEGVEPIEVEKPAEKAPRVGEWELDQADRKDLEGLLLQDMQDAAVTDEGLCELHTV